MKKFIKTLQNIWSITELRGKILLTLFFILIYRFSAHIILPGVDPNSPILTSRNSSQGLLGLFDTFAGGAFFNASITALGIMPYISASIFMQLMSVLVPSIQKIQKEGDSGRKKINQWTRYLTIGVTFFQAGPYVAFLNNMASKQDLIIYEAYQPYFWLSTVILLVIGTMFVMWLGERIQEKGIGNGVSIIIMVGIIARLPQSIVQEFLSKTNQGTGGLLIFVIEIVGLIFTILLIILLVQAVRKIPLNYARQMVSGSRGGGYGGNNARQYLPIKVNSAGVMPIIFAQAILFLPTLFSFTDIENAQGIVRIFSDPSNVWYMIFYSFCVIAFTYLYTALIFNPRQISSDLKKNNGFIPGVRPGEETAKFIGTIMDRITLPGAIFLALIGIFPGIVTLLGVSSGFAYFFGGTSLLIMVGVVLDTLQQIETHLLNHRYDTFMKGGRMQGRAGVVQG